ncbi:MAG TPA: TrmJ/YjtD family RNA methyltransferase [Candidatus Dormibacteraeota bacterium]|nr:TrmJ/YjtD family RNA methyltransferase [Candidatus Dormibacteraeota bacterium]
MAQGELAEAVAQIQPLRNVRIVLVRPRGAANIGAAARAMKNLGVADLTLVRPAVPRLQAAERMAVHARDLVRGARLAETVPAAVADCHLVVGTTCRTGGYRADVEDLAALAPAILERATAGPVAILFGPEDHGLSNADLRHCQRLCAIDSSDDYASLNLAQAVLLVCWELRRAARAGLPADPAAAAAPAGEVAALLDHLQAALLNIGYLNPQNPEHIMLALRGILGRAAVTAHDVRILRGLARQIDWAARRAEADSLPVDHRSPVTGHRSRS